MDPVSTLSMGGSGRAGLAANRLYAAVRIVSARRAFSLLCKQLAEVIAVERGWTYDFPTGATLLMFGVSLRRSVPVGPNARLELPVPPVVRLFS